VDGHNDLPWALRLLAGPDPAAAVAGTDLEAGVAEVQTDLPRLRAGRVGGQFWSVWVPCSYSGPDAVRTTLEQVDLVHLLAERYPSELQLATTADEAEAAFAAGRVASMLGAEGGHSIDSSLDALRELRRRGVRYMTLTHNENTPWADSATDEPVHGGLTEFGVEVVRECNRLGVIVDLSHVAATTMRDALAATSAPVLFTHSSCRAVADHPRNVPDDVLSALAGNGGVCMLTFVPVFVSAAAAEWSRRVGDAMAEVGVDPRDLDARNAFADRWDGPPCPEATLADVVTHIEHAREVAGIDHIGIGGDYDGTPTLPVGLADVASYPVLFAALLERGWSEQDCAKLAGRNVLRVLRASDAA
jgi:membrane dipeptidase